MQKKLLEAALFMSPKPLAMDELIKITGAESVAQLQGSINELKQDYQQRGMVINETPFGYQMQVQYELLPKVSHLTPYADLSEGCKRTLALAVYKEPITQSEIIKIQGNKAYNYVKGLEEMDLIKTERYGRTKLLKLTAEFERYFGMRKEQVRMLIEQQIGQPSPTNLNAFLPPTDAPDQTDGLKKLFAEKSVSEADIKSLSEVLKPVADHAPGTEAALTGNAAEQPLEVVPQLSVLDLWETAPTVETNVQRLTELKEAPTVVKRPASLKHTKQPSLAPAPLPPKLKARTATKAAPASAPPKPSPVALTLKSAAPAAPKLPKTRMPATLKPPKTAMPVALTPLRAKAPSSTPAPRFKPLAAPAVVPLKALRSKPATPRKAGAQMVLAAGGAEKPAVPVEQKDKKDKKKARRRVMHKSAVKEETRDEKNIFSSEGEIKL